MTSYYNICLGNNWDGRDTKLFTHATFAKKVYLS